MREALLPEWDFIPFRNVSGGIFNPTSHYTIHLRYLLRPPAQAGDSGQGCMCSWSEMPAFAGMTEKFSSRVVECENPAETFRKDVQHPFGNGIIARVYTW